MVGVRTRRRLVCGIAVWIAITVCIFFTFHSVSESGVDLSKDTNTMMTMEKSEKIDPPSVVKERDDVGRERDDVGNVGACQPLAIKTVEMISTSNKTMVEAPWTEVLETTRLCAELTYGPLEDLPRASVIITFHDTETISNLLHTIHSVIQRTPCPILQEIIVIDDFSRKEDLGNILEVYIRTVFSKQVKLFRNSENMGLIRARLKGARLSEGDVIIFMDSHSEVQPGWLEPLLYEIKKNRTTLVQSCFDWMEKKAGGWHYTRGASNWIVYFNWRLDFGWQTLSKQEEAKRKATDPLKTKAIIGTYAAIDRRFFEEIGELDDGMQFWGAENIDLSIRVWLFGGQVLSVPCSRVAHLEGGNLRAYRNNFTSTIERNYKRLVEVWFDEYKTYFYQFFPTLIPVDAGNLEERMKLKPRAKHNFSWFLQNVYPELGLPDKDSFAWGKLKNKQRELCLDNNADVTLYHCVSSSSNQMFYWSTRFEFRQPISIFNLSPKMVSGEERKVLTRLIYIPFYNNDLGAKWIHWKDGPLIEQESGLCLSAASDQFIVAMVPCNYENDRNQIWEFDHYTDQYFATITGNRSIEDQYKTLLSKLLTLKSALSKPVMMESERVPQNQSQPKAPASIT